MGTATEPATPHAVGQPTPAPNDPTHDVNGRAIVTWVLAWTAILFVGLYLLLILFDQMLAKNMTTKIEGLQDSQYLKQRQKEDAFLDGTQLEGKQGKTIQETIKEMARN